jgi:hypothetical protein
MRGRVPGARACVQAFVAFLVASASPLMDLSVVGRTASTTIEAIGWMLLNR